MEVEGRGRESRAGRRRAGSKTGRQRKEDHAGILLALEPPPPPLSCAAATAALTLRPFSSLAFLSSAFVEMAPGRRAAGRSGLAGGRFCASDWLRVSTNGMGTEGGFYD